MADAILDALKQVSTRMEKTLSEDGAKAVENLYKDTGERTDEVVKRVSEAETSNAKRFHSTLAKFDSDAAEVAKDPGDLRKASAAAKSRLDLAKLLDPKGAETRQAEKEFKAAKKAMDEDTKAQQTLAKKAESDKQQAVNDMYKDAEPKIVGEGENARLLNADKADPDLGKITGYVLNKKHDIGANKAKVFESSMGMTQEHAESLADQLVHNVRTQVPVPGRVDEHGQRFTITGDVTGPTGTAKVESGWIYSRNKTTGEISDTPRMTTAFVAELKKV